METLGRHKPKQPYTCGVRLFTKWLFPKTTGHRDGEYRTTRPDTDNLQKLLKDCMTRVGFWQDDAQVCREEVTKRWSREKPGIHIRVVSVNDA